MIAIQSRIGPALGVECQIAEARNPSKNPTPAHAPVTLAKPIHVQ
jgi:hypothetical protein